MKMNHPNIEIDQTSGLVWVSLILAFFLAAYPLLKRFFHGRQALPYPPGPPAPSFVLGHFGKLPMKKPWLVYAAMEKQYGDVIYFRSLGQHIIILNSLEATIDLLEKQARISSDRPYTTAVDKYVGWGGNIGFLAHDDTWRNGRRVFHQSFRADAVARYQSIQSAKVHQFLRALAEPANGSQNLLEHISTLSESVVVSIVYGLDIISNKEELPQAAKEAVDAVDLMLLPGYDTWKTIPFVHLLTKFGMIRSQRNCRVLINSIREGPFHAALEAWKAGNTRFSVVGEMISKYNVKGGLKDGIEHIKNVGWTATAAAADTTVSAIATFLLVISFNPHVQVKAQQELHQVLGHGRVPQFSDRLSLPYIEAIYREVMRWHPALPFGVPHKTTEDIIYKGYYLPKGSLLFANLW
ncbi:cytochrome p450 [Stygiomarasmius scandens]|uniref:Cytochrome p450 n=1 Tax=Marasmiellus scandens TaxID=2682957 RepID=A0ABR1IXI7_9AGAR